MRAALERARDTTTSDEDTWGALNDAIGFALACIHDGGDPADAADLDADRPGWEQARRALQAEVAQTIRDGDAPTRKALLQALIGEIRVEGRDQIRPSYCLPAVRVAPPGGSVPLRGFERRFPP